MQVSDDGGLMYVEWDVENQQLWASANLTWYKNIGRKFLFICYCAHVWKTDIQVGRNAIAKLRSAISGVMQ